MLGFDTVFHCVQNLLNRRKIGPSAKLGVEQIYSTLVRRKQSISDFLLVPSTPPVFETSRFINHYWYFSIPHTAGQLEPECNHWHECKAESANGSYHPQPVVSHPRNDVLRKARKARKRG